MSNYKPRFSLEQAYRRTWVADEYYFNGNKDHEGNTPEWQGKKNVLRGDPPPPRPKGKQK